MRKCPICRQAVDPDGPYAPFCSDRCKLPDLANWADENYRITTPRPEHGGSEEEQHE